MTDDLVDYTLANGEERNRENPRSFFIPARGERDSLAVGDLAKLLFEVVEPRDEMPSGERMWVEVTGRLEDMYTGVLLNVPAVITTIGRRDLIQFGSDHVIATTEGWPLLEKKILVSRRSHEQDVRPDYVYREDPDNERDSGWRALVGDESDAEVNDPHNILMQAVGLIVDRWPELRQVFRAEAAQQVWVWDADVGQYLQTPD